MNIHTKKKILVGIIFTLILGVFTLPVGAQSPVTAQVDRTDVTTDDVVILTIAVDEMNSRASQPQLPTLDGFQIAGQSSSTQISLINGDMKRQAVYQYSLYPLQTGTLVIDAIAVEIDGQVYTTAPIAVNVTQGTGQPSAPSQPQNPLGNFPSMGNLGGLGNLPNLGNLLGSLGMPGSMSNSSGNMPQTENPSPPPADLGNYTYYVEGQVDNDNPYQGEQVVYTFDFYQAESLFDSPSYQPPAFTGFWSNALEQTEHVVESGGRTYRVTQLQTVLFPTVVGELTIEPTTLEIPGDFYTRGGTLKTEPITINVKPLPDGAPASFNGAVGNFTIQTAVDTQSSMVNDTVTWRTAVSGEGNLQNLPEPIWNEGDEWRAFDTEVTTDARMSNGRYAGSVTYDRVLIPTTAGELTLPAVEYTFFNPATEQYETINSEVIRINVEGDGSQIAPNTVAPAVGNDGNPPMVGSEELRPLKPATEVGTTSAQPLTNRAGYWFLWLVPLFVLGGNYGWQVYQKRWAANADTRRSQQAAKRAQSALRTARQQSGDQSDVAGRILTTYLEDKLNRPLVGLTQSGLAVVLTEHGIEGALIERVQSCLTASEMGRYAPAGLNMANDALLDEMGQVIMELEQIL